MTASKLVIELNEVLTGQPWYGSPVINLLEQVDRQKVCAKSRGPHSIADILMHMIAWTEETTARLGGKFASDPARGDWPDPSKYSWAELVEMFVSGNEQLKAAIVKLDEDMFPREVNDNRYTEGSEKGSYAELIRELYSITYIIQPRSRS